MAEEVSTEKEYQEREEKVVSAEAAAAEEAEEKAILEAEELRKATALFTPEAIIMLSLAILLDLVDVICVILIWLAGVPQIVSWILDIICLIILGLWLLIRSQSVPETTMLARKVIEKRRAVGKAITKAEARAVARTGTRAGLRFVLAFVGEMIVIIGVIPFWTWFVWSELKS